MIQVLVIGGSPLLRAGVAAAIAPDARLRLVGQFRDAYEMVGHDRLTECDVLILNTATPCADIPPLLAKLKDAGTSPRVLVLTENERSDELLEAIRLGVHGYGLHATLQPEDLRDAVVGLARWGIWACPRVMRLIMTEATRLLGRFPTAWDALDLPLSRRELEVLQLTAGGQRERDIAEALCVSPNTVKTYLRRIRHKLQVDSRAEAISLAVERGLLPPASVGDHRKPPTVGSPPDLLTLQAASPRR